MNSPKFSQIQEMDVGKFMGKEHVNREIALKPKRWISAYSHSERDKPPQTQEKK
jgi:hypothetical protein